MFDAYRRFMLSQLSSPPRVLHLRHPLLVRTAKQTPSLLHPRKLRRGMAPANLPLPPLLQVCCPIF